VRTIEAGNLTIEGTSIAGICTSLHVPELRVVLDAGILHPKFSKRKSVFLSHCHMDHIGSLLALAGARDLKGFSSMHVFVPCGTENDVYSMIDSARKLDGSKIEVSVIDLQHGDRWHLPRAYAESFKTHHVLPSNGYKFFSKKKKLLPEFVGMEGQEIARIRGEGTEISYEDIHLRLAYATDTTLEVIDTSPEILDADVLILECTFLLDDVSIESARKHGHVHIDEIVANADKFNNKHLVLMHFSARYSNDEIIRIVDEKLPPGLRARTQLLLPNDDLR